VRVFRSVLRLGCIMLNSRDEATEQSANIKYMVSFSRRTTPYHHGHFPLLSVGFFGGKHDAANRRRCRKAAELQGSTLSQQSSLESTIWLHPGRLVPFKMPSPAPPTALEATYHLIDHGFQSLKGGALAGEGSCRSCTCLRPSRH
jgi:hypothetical protein